MSIFDDEVPENSMSRIWRLIRDPRSGHHERMRAIVEKCWESYGPHAERGFIKGIQSGEFQQRWWEMYLWHRLSLVADELKQPGKGMPDIRASWGNRHVYFECVAPTAGVGGNAIPECSGSAVYEVPQAEIILRMTSAISAKKVQTKARTERTRDGHNVVAVDTTLIRNSGFDERLCLASVFPLGSPQVTFFPNEGRAIWSNQYRPEIERPGRSSIPTSAFLDDSEYSVLSAALFCSASLGDIAEGASPRFLLVHNYRASKPLSRKLLRDHPQAFWNGTDSICFHRVQRLDPDHLTLDEILG